MNVGAAAIDITPDFPVELSGFASRVQPAAGMLEPIFARAIYLEDGGERLLWIACDVVALGRELVDGFRAWAGTRLRLEPRQVLLCATHTHNAPATVALNAAGQLSERFVRFLRYQMEGIALEATAKTRPCRLIRGSVACAMGVDRRAKPSAHVDSNLWALAFIDPDGQYPAAVLNYAMHPVALGHGERRIAPDWCGAASRTLSETLPGHPVALITNGAAGNINPPEVDISVAKVRRMGTMLARFALRPLARSRPAEATLAVKSITVPLPLETLDDAGIDRAADAFCSRFGPDHPWASLMHGVAATWTQSMKQAIAAGAGQVAEIEIQVARIGNVHIVAVNGELFSRFAELLRQRTAADLFVVGYANAAFGYIPARQAYAEGGYEVEDAHFFYNSFRPAEGGLEMLVDRALELIEQM